MDITFYRRREQAERAFAAQAHGEAARASHLDLAERYRELIEAYERIVPAARSDNAA